MKGLLLKDFYMAKKYCKSYLLIAAVFIAISCTNNGNMFFIFYPCLLCGMIPFNLLGYDERSRWMQYSGTLPYTKAQLVSSKYLIGLLAQLAMLLVTGIAQGVRMSMNGSFMVNDFAVLMLTMLIVAAITSSISLPFVFKLGVERGRVSYYFTLGIVCAAGAIASSLFSTNIQVNIEANGFLAILCLAGIGMYAFSWYLSIMFYKKREI